MSEIKEILESISDEEVEKWLKENTPLSIGNEDGTPFEPPENPLNEKWNKLYPPTRYGEPCGPVLGYTNDGKPIANYSCILCHEDKCPYSEYWKVPEEDKEVYEKWTKECNEYYKLHNPKTYEVINNYDKEMGTI